MAIDQSQYQITEFVISSERFPDQDLEIGTALISELNIYENIEYPYLTGNFLMRDDNGIRSAYGIYGNEELTITIEGPVGSDIQPITKKFMITKVEAGQRVSDRVSMDLYTIIEKHAYLNYIQKVSKKFEGKGESIIEKIMNDYFDMGYETKSALPSLQPAFRYIIPYQTPLDAIEMVRDRITSPQGTPFFFYSTLRSDKLILNDFETMFSSKPWNTYQRGTEYVYSQAGTNSSKTDFFYIRNWSPLSLESVLNVAMDGAYGSHFQVLDVTSAGAYNYLYNSSKTLANLYETGKLPGSIGKKIDNQALTVDDSLTIGKNDNVRKSVGEYKSKFYSTVAASKIYINSLDNYVNGYHDHSEDAGQYQKKLESKSLRNIMLRSVVNIDVAGAPYLQEERGVGNMIRVLVPLSSTADKGDTVIDQKLSGDYLIYQLRHVFTNEGYHTAGMNIVKVTNRESIAV